MIKKSKVKSQKSKTIFTFFLLLFFIACFVSYSQAKEITVLYTGETHAMLYPCSCPIQPDGGIARRGTLIKELRNKNRNLILLDSGAFFAGGQMDEYSQNTQLDIERTRVNLKALEMMHYDVLNIGDEELNFGKDFLEQAISGSKMQFISSNLEGLKPGIVKTLVIKDFQGVKVAIIGITNTSTAVKAAGIKVLNPVAVLKQSVQDAKKQNADIIIVLSHLGGADDKELLTKVSGIDVLIEGHLFEQREPVSKIGSTIVLKPSWEGRRMGKLNLTVEGKKIKDYKAEELRLSDKIANDRLILQILPACFSDVNCRKSGFIGSCQNPATKQARCNFELPPKTNLRVILPKKCRVCDTETVVDYYKKNFPGIEVSYIYYPGKEADKFIALNNSQGLPVYLLDKSIDKQRGFSAASKTLELQGDYYKVKDGYSGVSYFINRTAKKKQLDLFFSLYAQDTDKLLEMIRYFKPRLHFLVNEKDGVFTANSGQAEVEECLRGVCVQKYYPELFWDYLSCRAKNINSSWWEDCLGKADGLKIRACARSEEGKMLLRENIALNKEINVTMSPTYLLDDQEIFGTVGVPTRDEMKKIIK